MSPTKEHSQTSEAEPSHWVITNKIYWVAGNDFQETSRKGPQAEFGKHHKSGWGHESSTQRMVIWTLPTKETTQIFYQRKAELSLCLFFLLFFKNLNFCFKHFLYILFNAGLSDHLRLCAKSWSILFHGFPLCPFLVMRTKIQYGHED